MCRHVLRFALICLLGLAVSSCASMRRSDDGRLPLYDVRDATILAGAAVPRGLIRGVDTRLADAVRATRRPAPVPRVVLTVRIERVVKGAGEGGNRNEATVSVDAASVDSGAVVAAGDFKAITYTSSQQMVDQALAEAITARLRYIFALTTPPIEPVRRRPAIAAASAAEPVVSDSGVVADVPADADVPVTADVEPEAEQPVAKSKPVVVEPAVSDLEAGASGTISLQPKSAGGDPAVTPQADCAAGQDCPAAQ